MITAPSSGIMPVLEAGRHWQDCSNDQGRHRTVHNRFFALERERRPADGANSRSAERYLGQVDDRARQQGSENRDKRTGQIAERQFQSVALFPSPAPSSSRRRPRFSLRPASPPDGGGSLLAMSKEACVFPAMSISPVRQKRAGTKIRMRSKEPNAPAKLRDRGLENSSACRTRRRPDRRRPPFRLSRRPLSRRIGLPAPQPWIRARSPSGQRRGPRLSSRSQRTRQAS